MRKIITVTFVTMDGVMQAAGGPEEDTSSEFTHGGWQANVMDHSLGQILNELLTPPFAMLLGHTTYNIFAGFWPKQGQRTRSRRRSMPRRSTSCRTSHLRPTG